MRRCKDYRGVMRPEPACAAGIDVKSFGVSFKFWPCTNPGQPGCATARYPTREEAEASVDALDALVDDVLAVMKTVRETFKRGDTGMLKCPRCGNNIAVSVSRHNGHSMGRCATQGCISWIE